MKQAQRVRFSERTDFGTPDGTYARRKAQARAHTAFVDLTSSNPKSAGISLPHPLEWLQGAPPEYHPHPRGLLSARQALSRNYDERAHTTPDSFIVTASTSEAYSFALAVLCDPGDRILVPSPSYPLFEQLSQISGVELVRYRISYDGAFHIDLGSLPTKEEAQAQGIKAIFAVSPNNPTGNSLRPEELARLRSLRLPIVIDEVFRPYASQTWVDPLSFAHCEELLILVDGLSKRAAAPGLKLGWLLARGRHADEFLKRAEWVSDALLSPGSLVQHALPKILAEEGQPQSRILARLAQSRRILQQADLHRLGITELRTDGGWTALLRLPATLPEEDWWEQLSKAGLWLQPGQLYNLPQSPAFALSLLTPSEELSLALERLGKVVSEHS